MGEVTVILKPAQAGCSSSKQRLYSLQTRKPWRLRWAVFESSFQTRMNFPAPLGLQDATGPCLVPDSLLQLLLPTLHTYSETKKRGLRSSDPNPAYSWTLEGTGQFLSSPTLSISHVG